jgi:hypothetical protein
MVIDFRTMNTTVFVRPNLKIFLLGAVLLVVVQHLIATVHSQAQALAKPLLVQARELNERELQELIRYAIEKPTAEIYMRISHCFERRGDYRKALLYLRRAEQVSQLDGVGD